MVCVTPRCGEDVCNLADTNDLPAGILQYVEQGRAMRRRREVAPIAGAGEAAAGLAHEWAGDDSGDTVLVDQLARDLTEGVQPFEPEALLVRGDLQYRVAGRVDDRVQRAQMLLAELRDDLRAGSMPIAENPADSAATDQRLGELPWKTGLRVRKIPQSNSTGSPIISQCPLGVSLPRLRSAA